MGKAKQTVGVKVTAAEEILTKMPKDDVKLEVPITSVEKVLSDDCFNFEKQLYDKITEAESIITKMDDKHAWAIFLDRKLVQKITDNEGQVQNFLIGYENGLSARRNETHFSQKENDPISHRVIFQPEPTFISYSFFFGFFGQTIEAICDRYIASNTEWNISIRHQILKDFKDKYGFSFPKNPSLENTMYEYAEALIENIIDIQAKVGK